MKIKKLGHCCLVIEIDGKRIMTDPGSYSVLQNEEKNIDIVLFTHEHQDHFHLESLKKILENNKEVKIITNTSVGRLLDVENIKYEKLEEGGVGNFLGIDISGHGEKHEEIYEEFGQVQNTGFFIQNKLFYPGDAFTNPNKEIEVLALPVAGPFLKMKDVICYALSIKPRICFPVHDGMIKEDRPGPIYLVPSKVLPTQNIEFKKLEIGIETEL